MSDGAGTHVTRALTAVVLVLTTALFLFLLAGLVGVLWLAASGRVSPFDEGHWALPLLSGLILGGLTWFMGRAAWGLLASLRGRPGVALMPAGLRVGLALALGVASAAVGALGLVKGQFGYALSALGAGPIFLGHGLRGLEALRRRRPPPRA